MIDVERVLRDVRARSTSLDTVFHGEPHWFEVAAIGVALARATGADPLVVVLFGAIHDAMRLGDDEDPEHGARGAALARSLRLEGLGAARIDAIARACAGHTGGGTATDATIGTCWDADRLTLWRVGTRPRPRYMSTDAGRRAAVAGDAPPPGVSYPDWAALGEMAMRSASAS